jgi:hypothetical protein
MRGFFYFAFHSLLGEGCEWLCSSREGLYVSQSVNATLPRPEAGIALVQCFLTRLFYFQSMVSVFTAPSPNYLNFANNRLNPSNKTIQLTPTFVL